VSLLVQTTALSWHPRAEQTMLRRVVGRKPRKAMKCPQCGSEMQSGVAVVKSKPGIFSMFAGINGYQHLWFVPVDGSDTTAVRLATVNGEGELLQKAYQAGTAVRHRASHMIAVTAIGPHVPA
jgi:hypothetical protein